MGLNLLPTLWGSILIRNNSWHPVIICGAVEMVCYGQDSEPYTLHFAGRKLTRPSVIISGAVEMLWTG